MTMMRWHGAPLLGKAEVYRFVPGAWHWKCNCEHRRNEILCAGGRSRSFDGAWTKLIEHMNEEH